MKAKSAYDTTTEAWAKEWREANIDAPTNKLINQAFYDLMYGSVGDCAVGDPASDDGSDDWLNYPGFSKACDAIAKALEGLPSVLYLDVDAGFWQEKEPEPERCEDCGGEGEVEREDAPDVGLHSELFAKCEACRGLGCFEPAGEWYKLERHELRNIIVGKTLAEYL